MDVISATKTTDDEKGIEAEGGQVLRCSGPQLLCQPRAVGALSHAYSRAGLNVKGLSESRLRQLMEENIIRFPADLFIVFGNKNDHTYKDEGKIQVDDLFSVESALT